MGVKLNLGALNIKLTLDDENFRSSMARARKQLNSLGKGFAMSAGAGGAVLGAGVAYAVQQYSELEHAVMKAAAVTKEGAENFAAFQQASFAASAGTQFGAKEAAEALGFLSMAGFEAHQSIAALPGVLDLATAASIDLARASDITSDILKAARLDVTDLSHVNDVLVKTFTSSNTNLEMLGETMKYVMPVSASFGQSLETTAALAGVMADAGIKASMSGTAMRQMFLRLAKPMKTTRAAMKDLDISLRDGAGGFVDLIDVIGQLEDAQKRLSTADFNEKVARVFGAEALPGVLVLLDKGAEGLEKFRGELEKSGGTAERVASLMRETLSAQMKMLKGNVDNLAAQLGQMLAPALKKVVALLTKKVVALSTSRQAFRDTRDQVAAGLETFADFIRMLGMLSSGAIVVGGAFGEMVNILRVLALGLEAVSINVAQFAIIATEGFTDPQGAMMKVEALSDDMMAKFDEMGRVAMKGGTYLERAFDMSGKVAEGASALADAVEEGATELRDMTFETYEATVQADALVQKLNDVDNSLKNVKSSTEGASSALKKLTEDAVGALTKELAELDEELKKDLEALKEKNAKERKEAKEKAPKFEGSDIADSFQSLLEGFTKGVEQAVKATDQVAQQQIQARWVRHIEGLAAEFADVMNMVGAAVLSDHSVGHAALAGLTATVESSEQGMARLSDGLRGMYSALLQTVMETEEFKDNLALFKKIVREQTGIQGDLIPELMNTLDGLFGLVETLYEIRGPVEESRSQFDKFGERVFNVSKSATIAVFKFGRAIEVMRSGIFEVVRGIYQSIGDLIEKINRGLPERLEISTRMIDNVVADLTTAIATSSREIEEISDAINTLDALTYEEAKAKAEAAAEAERMAENMSELNSELRNAPSGFKRLLARRRFQADGGGMSAMSMQTSMLRPAPTSSTTHVHIYGVTKAEEVVEVLERKNFLSTGSMTAYQAARFNGSMRSKLTG